MLISSCGEYAIPYTVSVRRPQLQSSLGIIKNLFHFTNLAQTDWEEAVSLFYSRNFASILHKGDKNILLSYVGLSKNEENEQNVEEFLIETNKKTPVTYSFDIEGFLLEDVQDSIVKRVVITKSGWGYSCVNIRITGEFISTDRQLLTNADFTNNICDFEIFVDAARLHNGLNSGSVIFSDACNDYIIPFDILMEDEPERKNDNRKQRHALCNMVDAYAGMRLNRLTDEQWTASFEKELEVLLEIDEDSILHNLYRAQLLIAKERFN